MTRDAGSAAVVVLVAALAVALLGAVLGAVAGLLTARAQARLAADVAALAAAPVTFRPYGAGGAPTDEAARFAAANGARLVRCRCRVDRSWRTRIVEVEVERTARLLLVGTVRVRAVSRAEFAPVDLLARSSRGARRADDDHYEYSSVRDPLRHRGHRAAAGAGSRRSRPGRRGGSRLG